MPMVDTVTGAAVETSPEKSLHTIAESAIRIGERTLEQRDVLLELLQAWEPRVKCLQCGQRYSKPPCGPTHASVAALITLEYDQSAEQLLERRA